MKEKTRAETLAEVLSAITEARPARRPFDDFAAGVDKGFDDCWEIVLRMLEGKKWR